MSTAPASQKRERWAVFVLTALGAGLRFWRFSTLGLDHFDEGIYALSGMWIARPGGLAAIEPAVIPYSPPGFPALVGASYACFGISDLAAIVASTLCGVATVPVAAWLGRRTFGPGAGVAAAALVAFSGQHVVFSRVALTDVPFLLFWVLALGLGGRFLERPGLLRAMAFGVAIGVAQNFKYNGFLAGGIIALVVLLDLITGPSERRRLAVRALAWGVIAALISAVLYWPWFSFVDRHGGYAGLLAHHRGYMRRPSAWVGDWRLQLSEATALSGGPFWGLAAWGLAWLGCAACLWARTADGASMNTRRLGRLVLTGAFGGGAVLGVIPNITWWLGLALLVGLLRDGRPAVRVVGMWWLVMTVFTPFYHPYARLWLPLEAAGWLVAASVVVERWNRWAKSGYITESTPADDFDFLAALRRDSLLVCCMLLALLQQWTVAPHARPLPGLLRPTDGLRLAIDRLTAGLDKGTRLEFTAKQPVPFYLLTSERGNFSMVSGGGGSSPNGSDAALVEEPVQAPASGAAALDFSHVKGWHEAAIARVPLAPVTLLDVDPAAAFGGHDNESKSLRLFVRRPR